MLAFGSPLPSPRSRLWFCGLAVVATLAAILSVIVAAKVTGPGGVALLDGGQAQSAYVAGCSVFCEGRLLAEVQGARLFADSKTFVDMPLLADPLSVLDAFESAFPSGGPPPSRPALLAFVNRFFSPAGADMLPWVPTDWTEAPAQIVESTAGNATLCGWALGIHDLWLTLGRQTSVDVLTHPERHTLLWLPHPIIVPGGRFREAYYWDSFWIVLGLLRSGMVNTATGMARNLVHLLETVGLTPNGGRSYYILPGRSQPPLLAPIVDEVFSATGDLEFLRTAYAALKAEHAFWSLAGEYGHAVTIRAESGESHVLSRYVTDQHIPRPESWAEDVHTAAAAGHADPTSPGAQILYAEIAAAAESGIDFSGRWFGDAVNISTCEASLVIPVELNVFMFVLEDKLARFAAILKDAAVADQPLCAAESEMAASRRAALQVPPQPHAGQGWAGRAHDAALAAWETTQNAAAAAASSLQHRVFGPSSPTSRRSRPQSTIAYCKRHAASELCGDGLEDVVRDILTPRTVGGPAHSRVSWDAEREDGAVEMATGRGACTPSLADALQVDAVRFARAAADRARAIEALLWHEESSQWVDLRIAPDVMVHTDPSGTGHAVAPPVPVNVSRRYRLRNDLTLGTTVSRTQHSLASNFVPLWAGLGLGPNGSTLQGLPATGGRSGVAAPLMPLGSAGADVNVTRVRTVTQALLDSGLVGVGGVAQSTLQSAEQWDWPNGWAPLQHLLISGLHSTGEAGAQALAREIARRWLASGLAGYTASAPQRDGRAVLLPDGSSVAVPAGQMMEKMRADAVGQSGAKGEYKPQTGFGWSNGVALDLLVRYRFATVELPTAEGGAADVPDGSRAATGALPQPRRDLDHP